MVPDDEVDPLIFVPDMSISSPPTHGPCCTFAPAWKPPRKPLELIPNRGGILLPKIGSLNGSRAHP